MRLFGLNITRTKAAVAPFTSANSPAMSSVSSRGGWWPVIRESNTGAWQRNQEIIQTDVLTYSTVWSCVSLIASDVGKLWLNLVEEDEDGVCTPTENPAYSPVLRKPNHYMTRVKFFEYWIISKLIYGNTYALKERDGRGVVTALYVLDPSRVTVLVAPDGAVYYQLGTDYLSGVVESSFTVPAREIIHDICVPLYHPLVGVSPIHACGLAAIQGLKIQNNSSELFSKGVSLSGVLSTPHQISPDQQDRIEQQWALNFSGPDNAGKVAVVGDDLKFTPMTMTAVDAQLIDQLKWGSEQACACFHVPGYMVGIGPPPPYTDIQSINLQYYTQALQNPIENLETLLDEGLELKSPYHVEFDLAALARMDAKTQMDTATKGVGGAIYSPNEARAMFNLKPVTGGESPMAQQQMFNLEALKRRDDAQPAPDSMAPAAGTPKPAAAPAPPAEKDLEFELTDIGAMFRKELMAA